MEKEISNASMLGIIILGLSFLGVIGVIIYFVVSRFFLDSTGTFVLTIPQIIFLILSIFGISEFLFIKTNNDKLNIWDNSGYEFEDNLVVLADTDYYESSFQIRVPKKVTYLKALRCKLGDVSEIRRLKFGNDFVVEVKGKVKSMGEYYFIDNKYFKKGFILLNENQEVRFKVRAKINKNTALGIFEEYEVLYLM
jgi:hypothetical protein